MNIEQLRESLKEKWLDYYQENRSWLIRLGVWVNCDGQRRPSSSFILATLSILEPRLTHLFPLIVDLSNNPDRVVAALGLNFNPDAELEALAEKGAVMDDRPVKMLPSGTTSEASLMIPKRPSRLSTLVDDSCRGVGTERE